MKSIEIYQTPLKYKKFIHYSKFISLGFLIFTALMIFLMVSLDVFADIFTMISGPCMLLVLPVYIFLQRWFYDCKTESKVRLCENVIQIIDWRGRCQRELSYKEITDVRVESITGFFYGGDRENGTNEYICLFLNGCTEIPSVEYKKLYYQEDFILMAYDEQVYCTLKNRIKSA